MLPTQRSLKLLRDRGYRCEVVEKWIPRVNIRKDLFGFLDVLAIKDGKVLGVQATSDSNVSARVHKIGEAEAVADVRACGWSLVVHGWRKKDGRWIVREVDVTAPSEAKEP